MYILSTVESVGANWIVSSYIIMQYVQLNADPPVPGVKSEAERTSYYYVDGSC